MTKFIDFITIVVLIAVIVWLFKEVQPSTLAGLNNALANLKSYF